MLTPPTTDIWHVGIIRKSMGELAHTGLNNAKIIWLPEPHSFSFIADPFCVWRDNKLWILVEALDYRFKRGEIHYYCYDAALQLIDTGVALKAPFHLSYPVILQQDNETYILPEAHQSGNLTLYKSNKFPSDWEPVATLMDLPAIDASPIYYQGRWWMFYALPGENRRALKELHVAYADSLKGPWYQHAANPVRVAIDSARPGGMPFIHENALYLPTQDCTHDYGEAVNLLRIDILTTGQFEARCVQRLSPEGLTSRYVQGLHTFSGAGDISVIDAKYILRSQRRRLINVQRRLRRLLRYR